MEKNVQAWANAQARDYDGAEGVLKCKYMYQPQHLKAWTRPKNYFGATWEGYYVGPVARTRDSDHLTNSNWDQQNATLLPLRQDVPDEDTYSPQVVSENHWVVGWIEWLAIHQDNDEALRAADELAERLENYPVLDDDDYSRRQYDDAIDTWEQMSVRDRVHSFGEWMTSPLEAHKPWDRLSDRLKDRILDTIQ